MAGTDRTGDWLDWMQSGGSFTVDEGDSVHQCGVMKPGLDFSFVSRGHFLSLPANPAQNLLASDGQPVGAPHTPKRPGASYDLWRSDGAASLEFIGWMLDFNVLNPPDAPQTSAGMTSKLDSNISFEKTVLKNGYGGPLNSPDPLHIECSGAKIRGYTYTQNAIPIDYSKPGISDGIVFASGSNTLEDVEVEGVVVAGAAEIDGILAGGYLKDFSAYQILLGTLISEESWAGNLWTKVKAGPRQDGGPALQVSSPCGAGLTIEDSEFLGTDPIGNPQNFQGVWGRGNTPAALPTP